ncbi:DsbA family oxidoreductase [Thauera sp. CAU 1555]|uniref:DsbA family oxidoreductase n=1 Tax=Thauera sedimentorum TaxID=2767595 RepID=A0ABR9BEG0_9RHOO|nr:DsbA family oxidoreductase [Thauera sedimentorum]MBC9072697.1 DsbA family oxidoreductase [Thauera sedimentorum]MBD8503616.1 DsbA family oxidoreductase [Thauera sedimentorum]
MTLDIDLVSDFVCPWCFLGKVRLDQALAELRTERPGLDVRVNWLPFFLNPDTPPAGEPYRAFLEAKFGGPRGADAVQQQMAEAAADDGLVFAFERIAVRPNTLKAHRLCYRAQRLGNTPARIKALTDALFAAHFQQGLDIGNSEVLADLAVAAGGERRDEVLEYLNSNEDAAAVKRMAAGIQQQGVSGVPFFILNRKLGVSGAQSAAVLGAAILQSLGEGGQA